jgi:proteasome activator subunit 4
VLVAVAAFADARIVQLLEDEPFGPLQELIEELIAGTDQNKQRGAAEFLAGLLNGAKSWPTNSQQRLWDWAMPLIRQAFKQKIKTDTLPVWTSFLDVRLLITTLDSSSLTFSV